MISGVRIELDHAADAAYIALGDGEVMSTHQVTPSVLVDCDEFRMAVGIEVLGLDAEIPFHVLQERFHIRSDVLDAVRLIRPSVAFVLQATTGECGSTAARPRQQISQRL